jgi:hypothetical protein
MNFWKFITKVYEGEDGGFGLLVAFAILCSSVVAIFKMLF